MNTFSSIVIHLDSSNATQKLENDSDGNPLSTNFIYNLVEPIEIPRNEDCEISLYTTTIPYSFYNCRSGVNNTIQIQYVDNTPTLNEIATILLDEGNYSATALKSAFIKKVSELDSNTYPIISSLTFEITYSRETLKYEFTLTTSLPNCSGFSIDFLLAKSLFGFRVAMPQQFTSIDTKRTLKSDICIDINDSIHGLYVRTNLSSKSTLDNENGTFSNILARIPINTNAGGIIFHTPNNSKHKSKVSLHSIQSIGLKLTDDKNRIINLNGLDFQVSLLIDFVPIQPKVYPIDKYRHRIIESQPTKKTKKKSKSKK